MAPRFLNEFERVAERLDANPGFGTPASEARRTYPLRELDMAFLSEAALERKPLNDGLRSRSKTNLVEARAFSERLEDAIARYHANAINTAEVLQRLIDIAKEFRAARTGGEEQDVSDEEYAFCLAPAEKDSAVEVLGNPQLLVIGHEVLLGLRDNVPVDGAHRAPARARLRVPVKRILRKYGYPPDLQDAAVRTLLQQAEVWSARWSAGR